MSSFRLYYAPTYAVQWTCCYIKTIRLGFVTFFLSYFPSGHLCLPTISVSLCQHLKYCTVKQNCVQRIWAGNSPHSPREGSRFKYVQLISVFSFWWRKGALCWSLGVTIDYITHNSRDGKKDGSRHPCVVMATRWCIFPSLGIGYLLCKELMVWTLHLCH